MVMPLSRHSLEVYWRIDNAEVREDVEVHNDEDGDDDDDDDVHDHDDADDEVYDDDHAHDENHDEVHDVQGFMVSEGALCS